MQQPARNLSALAGPLYAVAIMLMVVPILEVGSQLGWTASPSTLNWRTGAVGLLSGALLTPTFGLVVGVVTASVFQHRWIQRLLIALTAFSAIGCVVLLLTFALDSLQLRPTVTEAMRRAYTVAMLRAFVNLAVTIVVLAIVCVGAFKARASGPAGRGRTPQDSLLVGASGKSDG
jgi:hypothetical protein